MPELWKCEACKSLIDRLHNRVDELEINLEDSEWREHQTTNRFHASQEKYADLQAQLTKYMEMRDYLLTIKPDAKWLSFMQDE